MIDRKFLNHRMSRLSIHNGTVYSCGIVAKDNSKEIKSQTQQVLDTVDELLAEGGSDKSSILSMQIWISDMKNFNDMNEVYDAWVDKGNPPTRACVEAKIAKPEYLLEMRFIAVVNQDLSGK